MTDRALTARLASTVVALAQALLHAPAGRLHAGLCAGSHEPSRVYRDLLRLAFRALFRLSVDGDTRADTRGPRSFSLLADLDSLAGTSLDEAPLVAHVSALWQDPLDREGFLALGESLEELLARQPHVDPGTATFTLVEGHERKATGSYYTPAPLVEQLLAMTLDPLLDRACASPDPRAALRALRVLDPACGAGHLLLAAARRIAERLARLGEPDHETTPHLYGIDLHPVAAELCRLRLARLARDPWRALDELGDRVRCGDGLAAERGEGFDAVVGNPPYVNAIRGGLAPDERARLRTRLPEFGGTADLAYLMLGAAVRLARPAGRVGMVLPRGVLNARSAERFRAAPPGGFRLVRMWVPPRADLFAGAAVFVCLVTLARSDDTACEVCLDDTPGRPESWHRGLVTSSNWWSEAQAIVAHDEAGSRARTAAHGDRLGDRFEVTASMTAGDAYDAAPFVIDERDGAGPRLVTTGLIDPGSCLWGERACRYLRRDLMHPRLVLGEAATRSLQRRVAAARRPKILVAGLSRVVECFLDREGEHIGAVSTYSIYHPRDEVSELEALCEHLLSDEVSERFRVELGAGALGGGNTTMRKDFLRQLLLPAG